MKLEILNPVETRVKATYAKNLIPCLSFKAEYWKDGKFHKERKEYYKQVFTRKENDYWYFWTGLMPKVIRFCENRKIPLKINNNIEDFYSYSGKAPNLNGIVFRQDQLDLIKKAVSKRRGIIKAPTGSGKTLLQLGILSIFDQASTLILAHRLDIVKQTYDELCKYGFNAAILGGKYTEITGNPKILVSTMQTYVKWVRKGMDPKYFDVVICDESHHISSMSGTYAEILSNCHANVRLGFTATLNNDTEAQFATEGLIGPVIGELTIDEAVELGILAEPKIKLIKSRYNPKIRELRTYPTVYDEGIVHNKHRNQTIVDLAHGYAKEGKTVLIMVTKIDHGKNIENLGSFTFVRGETTGEARDIAKKLLIDKKLKVIITTNVWREGINIPNLDVVINAGGGKSEIATLQSIGRGLRKTDDKEKVIIVDFFDPSHYYLIAHFGERITLYMDNGWL